MPVSATESASASSTLAWGNSTTAARTLKKTSLGSDDFMKLLAVQFQSQDPMKPMEDTAFIAQMAQFTSLDQSNSLVREMGLLRSDQQNLTASGMLGRTVTVSDADGLPVSGQVTAVENTAKGPVLIIDGNKYPLSTVQRVEYTPYSPAELPPAA
ncbi:flagellar basal body rod modification protein [Lacunisphaera limnophila]|uniref:Basal-body rod modification protein FlgD n=1 Tax=Lacunisphaera limnophila TaxID=1838286 RepID=A0A1D8AW79_9BACT|nr:flagellar hook capping FlgD N-terminal domain-containing protein [Lacunisphaera limnophila]AOS45115.1 flagellar basal body rod modification protein [Lacunisphaera limnophila]